MAMTPPADESSGDPQKSTLLQEFESFRCNLASYIEQTYDNQRLQISAGCSDGLWYILVSIYYMYILYDVVI